MEQARRVGPARSIGGGSASGKEIALAWINALFAFDSGENAINPGARILKIPKQIGDW